MKPHELAAHLNRCADALPDALARAEEETGHQVLQEARALSQGPFSLHALRRMGHPYAVRDPHPPQDDAIINLQGGDFWNGWEVDLPIVGSDEISSSVTNDTEEAEYLENGTPRMIRRSTAERLAERVEADRLSRLEDTLETLLQP